MPLLLPSAIRRALAIPPQRRHGNLNDVEHIVVLMQENRSFDHYFGTLAGVRGFGDRFPIPVADAPGVVDKNVWYQTHVRGDGGPSVITPFRLDTEQSFEYMRVTGTPHNWVNAQQAWADGRMNEWPRYKNDHAMGYFTRDDIPFQFAMAEAFTLCDAYHCSFQGGTNPNRLFLWTGNNDPLQLGKGPAINNDYDNLENDPDGGYTWVTYTERLQAAGISWQVYENMDDNFTDNPLAGFRSYRDAYSNLPGALTALKERGLSTRDLDKLKEDVLSGRLPQVSFIVATAEGSEHPGPSSPAQGADYTALVLDALTANPDVWSKTVFLVNFDENDGFFDHAPPPAAPSYLSAPVAGTTPELAGASTVDTLGEYHQFLAPNVDEVGRSLQYKPYGLGPRVPLYVLSPWSRGGWVNSEVFDHTSVIRLIEQRFGVFEPNISAWRRSVCGD
ncbi:MAG: phospholipase C, phosphocholine-specific [Polyangiaceae bacterium]